MFRPSEELILIHKSIENLPKVKEFLSSIAENSVFGNLGYKTSLACLHQFLTVKHSGMTLETIISSFKSGIIDVYKFLNEFVSFLETKNLAKSTMHQYMTSVKSYLQFHDIDIVPYKFKKRVKLPKIPKKEELAIDQNDIRTILLQCHNHRLKTYLLVLASSGVRATEACALRIRDINFDESPTKIHIRAEYTKTKQDRDIYFSDEASKYLKEYIEQRFGIDFKTKRIDEQLGDCLVFQVQDVNIRQVKPQAIYRKFVEEFHKVLDSVGFGQRKDGMSKRRKITLHSFRRFVKTVTSDQAGQDYSEWYLGHSKSSYYVSKPAVRAEIYGTKCMKYLTFLDYSTLEATGRSTEAKIKEFEKESLITTQKHDQEMKAVHEQMTTMGSQLQKIITTIANSDESTKNKWVKQLVTSQIFKPNKKRL